jgi:hypothetical protein
MKNTGLIRFCLAFLVALLYLSSFTFSLEYKLENWKTYTSMLDATSASIDSQDRIWVGTSGGLFIVDSEDDIIDEYRNINALISLGITVVKCYPEKQLCYIGTSDGILEIASEDMQWTHITDIQMSSFENKKITDILFIGNKAYISGGFGISVFDIEKQVFIETASRLGNFSSNTMVNKIVLNDDIIWAATDKGLAYININSLFSDPSEWNNLTADNGIPEPEIKDITFYNDTLFILTDHTISKYAGEEFIEIERVEDYELHNLGVYNNKLTFSGAWFLQTTDYDFNNIPYPSTINKFFVGEMNGEETCFLLFQKNGLGIYNNDTIIEYAPNSPISNQFTGIEVDHDDNVWVVTGTSESGDGFMAMKDGVWENFSREVNEQITNNNYWKVSVLGNNQKIISGYGPGYIQIDDSGDDIKMDFYSDDNSPLVGFLPGFVIVGEVKQDYFGNTWMVNFGENTGGPVLLAFDNNNEIHTFTNCRSSADRNYIYLEIDYSGTKWMSSYNPVGLFYYNDRGTLDDVSDDICGNITKSNSALPENSCYTIEIDANDMLWVGTSEGLSVILNPYSVLSGGDIIVRNVNIIGNQRVNDILVDALDNKWIATNDGVWLLNPDATEVLGHFTTENSSIISNEIIALATNERNGKMYFGSEMGMSEATGLSIQPAKDYDIKCFPQPFYPDIDEFLSIEGLAASTDLRILTVNGELVKSITTNSRKTQWDGTNENGDLVESGVYLVVAKSTSEDKDGVAKIAVIRK